MTSTVDALLTAVRGASEIVLQGGTSLPGNPDMAFLLICLLIFCGSLLAGAVPFVLAVKEKQISLLTAFGAGLLVSTALAIILPEGFEAFHEAQESSSSNVPHSILGLTIVAGFALMLVIDQLQGGTEHMREVAHESDDEESLMGTVSAANAYASSSVEKQQQTGSRALVGLLVHSLADGVAVGTTGVSGKEGLKLVVAFAMILHKLPATFGLVTFLVSCKWRRGSIFKALLLFAASAPLMALATYWILVAIPSLSSDLAVALWLSASGGTFLYAACMHVLPHVSAPEAAMTWPQLLAVLAGCGVPVLIQLLSKHSHSTRDAADTLVRETLPRAF